MATLHLRKGSKERFDLLSKESTESTSSSMTISTTRSSTTTTRRPLPPRSSPRSRSSPHSIAWVALTVSAALLVLSPGLTLSNNSRSLLEQQQSKKKKKNSTLRTAPQSVASVVHKKLLNPSQAIVSNAANAAATTAATIRRTTKPTMLIHIGPPKTGTTTLQCHLGLHFAKMVEEDNFYYLGTWYAPLCGLPLEHQIPGFQNVPRPMLLDCYAPHVQKECNQDEQWSQFGALIQQHYDMGHNLILSDEMFHHHFQLEDVQRLKSLLSKKWKVKIMYTYRHFYSSVPSMYHQLNDPYATEKGMANAVEKTLWPSTDGGYRIRSFRESNSFDIQSDMLRFSYWVQEFGSVQVFNMESTKGGGGGGYLASFLCTMMPELKTSSSFYCHENDIAMAAVEESTPTLDDSSRNDNGSAKKFLHYDMMAVAAKDAGLLDSHTYLQRTEVRDAIQQFCEDNGWNDISNFALDCLSQQEMESFLQASLEQAKMMQEYFVVSAPGKEWPLLEQEIKTGFWKHAERKQFCSIDTVASLQEERWQTFFRTRYHNDGGGEGDVTSAETAS
ncbi:unnamed protein product [Cylindrotheca closterium]|uniref:Sulfotransferase domain-containing protein n=1 Tax=Cylindrotheca closterium TaxID=2856 RepID=A0AAD2JMH8_9STRA|nr:unnamed protein product [Cylindrotheca closterium]